VKKQLTLGRRSADCPDDGVLRAMLESDEPSDGAGRHVAECAHCAARIEQLRALADWAQAAVASLGPSEPIDSQRAWRRLDQRMNLNQTEEGRSMETTPALWNRGIVRAATAAVAVVALMVAFTVSPARGLADGVLDRFRVQKFAVVTIPMDFVQPFEGALQSGLANGDAAQFQQELSDLGTFSTTFSMDSARQVGSIDEAHSIYGDFDVPADGAVPADFGTPNVYVSDPGSATYELNTAKAQEIIDSLNLPIYALPDPATYPTLTFTVDAPAAVGLEYTDSAGNRIVVGQMESPTLTTPDGLDMNQLRDDILRFPGLPADLVAQLRAIDDWQHTLIIPIPQGADSHDVTVHGQPGLVITMPDNGGSAVLWQDNGVLHLVAGQVDDNVVLDIANSLH